MPRKRAADDTEHLIVVIHCRMTERERAELRQVEAELDMDCSSVIREAVNCFVGDYREGPLFRKQPRRS